MQLPIFPPQALDSSVITTVWLGLSVIAFFNLRFGTTMAGLVVPGYLVPMLIVKPAAAVVILAEAVATYALVRLVADLSMRAAGATELFGRDRYFAILLMSVLVRVAGDVWLLPELGQWLAGQGFVFDWRGNLHSFGLVIVALTANQFWNGGLRRGLGYFALYVGVTWFITRFVLVPFTNFDITSLHFVYEDMAADILASPKAYMIILATAFFSSRLNLNFGWDFSGIMVPALIALLWYEPWRLGTTLMETVLVYVLGRVVLRWPVFRRLNMEGARLLLLFATVAYAYKLAIGFALGALAPQYRPTDFFAFGYLISTLLAVKMYGKQLTWQLGANTLSASLFGLVAANVLGFLLTTPVQTPAPSRHAVEAGVADRTSLPVRVAELRRELFQLQNRDPDNTRILDATGLMRGLEALLRYRDADRHGKDAAARLDAARTLLNASGYSLESVGSWLLVVDRDSARRSGMYAVNLAPRTGMLVSVPAPLDEPGTMAAAARLAESGGHAMLAVAGMRMDRLAGRRSDPLRNIRLPFARMHALAEEGVLLVRGMQEGRDRGGVQLWVRGALPAGLAPAWMTQELGPVAPRWDRRDHDNALREASTVPFVELLLDGEARLRLLARGQRQPAFRSVDGLQPIDGFLFEWLIRRKAALAAVGSERPAVPALGDLLYVQQEVIQPALEAATRWRGDPGDADGLRAIAASAASVGFETLVYRQQDTGETHLILTESGAQARYWGTYVFRMGQAEALAVEIPRPVEESHSFEYGTSLYAQLRARALLVSGAHARARADGQADVLAEGNRLTMYNAIHQALLLQTRQHWFLQVRGRTAATDAPQVTVAFAGPPPGVEEQARARQLLGSLRRARAGVEIAGERPGSSGPFRPVDPQADATRRLTRHRFVALWVTPGLRSAYRSPIAGDPDAALFADLSIPTRTAPVAEAIAAWGEASPPPAEIRMLADRFATHRDPSFLIDLRARGWALQRWVDPTTGESLLELRRDASRALRSLDPDANGEVRVAPGRHAAALRADAAGFMLERSAWLLPDASAVAPR